MSQCRSLAGGEILFREGDAAHACYVILSGHVILSRVGSAGPVEIDTLGQGDLVGEAALLRTGVYPMTAAAVSKVEVEEIDRAGFTARIAREPEMALRLVGRFNRRFDTMAERLVHLNALSVLQAAASVQPRGLSRLFQFLRGRRLSPDTAAAAESAEPLTVAVAALPNDDGDAQRSLIAEALSSVSGVKVVLLKDAVEAPTDGGLLTVLTHANRLARRMLVRENADVVVWGLVDPPAGLLELHFVSFSERDEERPGAPSLLTWLGVPTDFDPEWEPLIAAVTLAAVEARSENQSRTLMAVLPGLIEESRQLAFDPPPDLGATEEAALQTCFGNAAATLGHLTQTESWSDLALEAYSAALEVLPRDADLEWAMLNRSIGLVRQAVGERTANPDMLGDAAEAYKAALEGVLRRDTPRDWAMLQYRIGEVLYKKTLMDGTDAFRECIDCLQLALQVFTRTDYPAKWAEIVNLLAQVLQVYGEEVRAVSLLKRAVDLARQVLDVRTLDTVPLGWAAAQNTLGSALFLLARNTNDRARLEEAAEAFRSALGTYRMMGAEKGAQVAENNLKRVEETQHRWGGVRPKPDPGWAVPAAASGADGPAVAASGGLRTNPPSVRSENGG